MIRGQVVIPAKIRRRLGLKQGSRLAVGEEDGRIVLEPVERLIESLCGSLKGTGIARSLIEDRAADLVREEAELGRKRPRRR